MCAVSKYNSSCCVLAKAGRGRKGEGGERETSELLKQWFLFVRLTNVCSNIKKIKST